MSNVRIIPDPRAANALAAFFDQFERALPGFVPVYSEADLTEIGRDLVAQVGSTEWWDRLMRATDGKAAAIEFRDRMRVERSSHVDNRA